MQQKGPAREESPKSYFSCSGPASFSSGPLPGHFGASTEHLLISCILYLLPFFPVREKGERLDKRSDTCLNSDFPWHTFQNIFKETMNCTAKWTKFTDLWPHVLGSCILENLLSGELDAFVLKATGHHFNNTPHYVPLTQPFRREGHRLFESNQLLKDYFHS